MKQGVHTIGREGRIRDGLVGEIMYGALEDGSDER